MKKRVLGIVGPTASGKTALSLTVAERLKGEILCMDSMQIYRGMDIGTAKPTKEEQARVPHHLHSFLDPDEAFSVSQYAELARQKIEEVALPILVGGTGMYLQSLSLPMDYGAVGGDEEIRRKYHKSLIPRGWNRCINYWSRRTPFPLKSSTPTMCAGWCGPWRCTI